MTLTMPVTPATIAVRPKRNLLGGPVYTTESTGYPFVPATRQRNTETDRELPADNLAPYEDDMALPGTDSSSDWLPTAADLGWRWDTHRVTSGQIDEIDPTEELDARSDDWGFHVVSM